MAPLLEEVFELILAQLWISNNFFFFLNVVPFVSLYLCIQPGLLWTKIVIFRSLLPADPLLCSAPARELAFGNIQREASQEGKALLLALGSWESVIILAELLCKVWKTS